MIDKKQKVGAPVGNRNAAKKDKFDATLNPVACTAWQKSGWVKAAMKDGKKLPDFVRDELDGAARKRGIKI